MSVTQLIFDILHAEGPDRALDLRIAAVIGYEKKVVSIEKDGSRIGKVVWLAPRNRTAGPVPLFTGNIDAARRLSGRLMPGSAGGFSWGKNFCTAAINDGPKFNAATPSLAICAAALSAAHTSGLLPIQEGR